MDLEKASKRPWWKTWRLFVLLVIAAIILIIIIAVPCAVILSEHHHAAKAASVMLPLYIYPTNSTVWSPLFTALDDNPSLNFIIIVNPDSGPGSNPSPAQGWADGVAELNSHENVRTVGYIPTHYATRNISEVLADVATYAGWSANSSGIAVDGIFFDEAPYVFTSSAGEYMRTIDEAVKNTDGFKHERTVIHNPGVIPDARFKDTNLDITVVFEGDYSQWLGNRSTAVEALPSDRESYSIMINSVPKMSNSTLSSFLDDISLQVENIFVTTSSQNFYESFSSDWVQFAGAMPVKASSSF